MGKAEFSDFDSLLYLSPNPSFDFMIRSYLRTTNSDPNSVLSSPWTDRALADLPLSALATKRKYKPVHRKVRPVPTYMPNPEAQFFGEIPLPKLTDLPTHPRDYHQLEFGSRVTLPRLKMMLARIEPGILTKTEIDLLASVVVARESAFAFDYSEKGCFSRDYYPDYEIPTIEHTPWQRKPITIPAAIIDDVRKVIADNEAAGRFEPTVSSYRSPMLLLARSPAQIHQYVLSLVLRS
jgi:hypothetical protein